MGRIRGTLCILFIVSVAHSQVIEITGTVTSSGGQPIKNAIVTLLGKDLIGTTNSSGEFSISNGGVPVESVFMVPKCEEINFKNGVLNFSLPEPSPLTIELFDITGNLLEREVQKNVSSGIYHYDITRRGYAARLMIIRASIGQRVVTFRYLPLHNGKSAVFTSIKSRSVMDGTFAKLLANKVDSLKITADGYESKVVSIGSYKEEVKVVLNAVSDLPHFSFFVTSLASLQELSDSIDGFGGDLRFGHTGPGAGLKGADSICECIAEMSMPGSKVKQWRAFLSVSKDENGKQVDARDRIGQGPWYDREGRLLAPTLQDLLKSRPENGDAEIKNDLPNEWGIPNRTPDPSKGQIDNHHMITGSDSTGRLYKPVDKPLATCEDWTSSEASTGARCGLSFPRDYGGGGGGFELPKTKFGGGGGGFGGMDGSHWISAFDAPGCEPGTDLTMASMGGKRGDTIIGSGGGYGGFYCFALIP